MTLARDRHLARRLRIFALGASVSIALVAVFFTLAWLVDDSPSYAWVGRLLLWLFAVLNPLLHIYYFVIQRAFPAPSPEGLLAIQASFVVVFLGWWWLVAVTVDRVLARSRPGLGAA